MAVNLGTGIDPTKRPYHLKCKIILKNRPHRDGMGNQYSADIVILVPEYNDEALRFYRAWEVEEPSDNYKFEFPVSYPAPIALSGRGTVAWPNEVHDQIHILVMNKAVEDILAKKDGEIIRVVVRSADEDDLADEAGEIDEHDEDDVPGSVRID